MSYRRLKIFNHFAFKEKLGSERHVIAVLGTFMRRWTAIFLWQAAASVH
jgi:hypothetical protein